MKYNFRKIEKKWQNVWQKKKFLMWRTIDFVKKPKIYILDMFPYISGEGLHVGHVEGYTATDILSRFYRMNGYNVLHPMGYDAFGLPTENFAIKIKKNPLSFVPKHIDRFRKQLRSIGFSYDWSREIATIDPEYYKWTQLMFLKMYEKGLVYEKEAPINFCPSCKTGLADEEAIGGRCERCGSQTEIKYLKQWHIKITLYAERLLNDLETLDWPENIKEMQRNWIGKSEGYEVLFSLENSNEKIAVFTTRLDTIYGATFVVLSPHHPLALKITQPDYLLNVENYIYEEIKKERFGIYEKEITGVFTGSYVINPLNNKKIPIWISSYVLAGYGTGAIMGVPAHDERDFNFAKKFDLEIIQVVKPEKRIKIELPYVEEGILISSGEYSGFKSDEAREKIGQDLIDRGLAKKTVYYKLRDWIFSRQRYWGEPIPLIRCPQCGVVPLKEKDLPVTLPKVKSYEPTGTGESPLKNIKIWIKTRCPQCKGPAERETQTMPQWAGSCWYYLAYILKNQKSKGKYEIVWDKNKLKYWLPVDFYVGGAEHAVLHLLYARFWHKFLYDIGWVHNKEPFQKLFNQGLILGPDGQKMSKSKGNVINPDEVVKEYGADTLRMYEMFLGPLEAEKPWSVEGIKGVFRFLNRVWSLAQKLKKEKPDKSKKSDEEIKYALNSLIYETTEGIKKMRFNVVISKMMVFEDLLRAKIEKENIYDREAFLTFIKLLFPFAPHLSQEIWSLFGKKNLLDFEPWPKYDPKLLEKKQFSIVVQINGKKRGILISDKETLTEKEIKEKVKALPLYEKYLKNKKISKIIFVKGKIINFVVK
ncbi:MAG: leucine--tRNA ligase [Candidatus Parcubacteria bacterium]|nr:MAG: leucine--tRNA ligase [Candidatus Parcubacteria bacterium]